jgi:tetratricopeptide (TPR) repeat protein
MKKIIVYLIMSFSILFAEEELNVMDQKEMIFILENQVKNDPGKGSYELGLVYEDGILNSKNEKIPDIQKATKYYIMAFENKDYRSTYKIINLLLEKEEYKEAIKTLQKLITDSTQNRSLLISSITIYGTIVLDHLANERDTVIDALYNYSYLSKQELDEVATAKFIKAALLATIGNIEEGEKLLNEACYSVDAPKELVDKCFDKNNFDLEEGKNDKKSINEPCCNILEQ